MKTDCRYFSGYRPCQKSSKCEGCQKYSQVRQSLLIVHLGAIGAVVRSTSLLSQIKAQYTDSYITWVTERPSDKLLQGHPDIDQVLSSDFSDLLSLKARKFDVAFVIDKSAKAVGIVADLDCKKILGFKLNPINGAILPANSEALPLWNLGLDNHQKFFVNQKSEVHLVAEALCLVTTQKYLPLNYEYNLPLTAQETLKKNKLEQQWRINRQQPIIGFNTGCSEVIAAKKLSVEYQRNLIRKLKQQGFQNIVLLGGPEDTHRNQQIALGLDVTESPTQEGLRSGLVSVAACDIIITGDSLGMHMAISQRKFVIAWFGPTCAQEIELYGRGVKILSQATCAPCWKRTCEMSTMCYDLVDINSIMTAVEVGVKKWTLPVPAQFNNLRQI